MRLGNEETTTIIIDLVFFMLISDGDGVVDGYFSIILYIFCISFVQRLIAAVRSEVDSN
jgi:hypothetical protein